MSVVTILSFRFCYDFVAEFSDIHLGKTKFIEVGIMI